MSLFKPTCNDGIGDAKEQEKDTAKDDGDDPDGKFFDLASCASGMTFSPSPDHIQILNGKDQWAEQTLEPAKHPEIDPRGHAMLGSDGQRDKCQQGHPDVPG